MSNMSEEILQEKMIKVAQRLSETKGGLKLFALNWISDLDKWDIIVSADWVDYGHLRDTISAIFQEVKKEFNGQYSVTFSGIHPLKPEEPFVANVTSAFNFPDGTVDLAKAQFGNVQIEKMILIVSRAS